MKTPIQKPSRTFRFLKPRLGHGLAAASLLLVAATLHAAVPPDPTVELRFPEGPDLAGGNGVTTTNTGTLGDLATFAQPVDPVYETNLAPYFSTNVPVGTYVPAANAYSVNMGEIIGNSGGGSHGRAIDLTPPPGAYPELTICGWLNASLSANCRIVYALESPNGLGFEMQMYNNGVISLGLNQNNNIIRASNFQLPLNASTPASNWVYFAVTYNPSLGSGQMKYYFGRPNQLAQLDVARDYVPPFSPTIDFPGNLTVGNFSGIDGGRDSLLGGNSQIFRGLLDEIKIYTNALTLDQVQSAQVNAALTPVAASILTPPIPTTAIAGQSPVFTVTATGTGLVTYQWKTNDVNVAGATNASFTVANVLLTQNGTLVSVGVSNTVGGVVSTPVTLTVLPSDPLIVTHSFSEGGTSPTTTNIGSLAGNGVFIRNSGLPLFINTNYPSGPYAPTPTYNAAAINYGDAGANRAIDLTNNLVSAAGQLGSLNALTICGWMNSANITFRTTSSGRGVGVVSATRGGTAGGFALAYRNNSLGTAPYGENGRLALYVNDWPAGDPTASQLSPVDTIPLSSNAAPANWVYFAVTYDGTIATDNLTYYFGDPNNLATNTGPLTYNKGVMPVTGQLTVGNFQVAAGNPTGRTVGGANGTAFRGLLDEIKVFSKVLTLAEIRAQQVTPALPTLLVYSNSGPDFVLSWETEAIFPYQLQSQTNVAAAVWNNVPNSESVVGRVHSVAVARTNDNQFFRIKRQ
jgi:hypothetical protein